MKIFTLKFKKGGWLLAALVCMNIASTTFINGKDMENNNISYLSKRTVLIALPIIAALIGSGMLLAKSELPWKKYLAINSVTGTSEKTTIATGKNTSQEEQQFLFTLVDNLGDYASKVDRRIDAFFDKKNNQSYENHVAGFKGELNHIDTIIASLHTRIRAKDTHSSALYTTIVEQAHAILHNLRKHLVALHDVLEKNKKTKKAFPLIKDLRQLEGPAKKQLVAIEKQVQNLYSMTLKYNASLAQHVNNLRTKLHRLSNKNGSLTGLVHRLKC